MYGFVITDAGRGLLARSSAGQPLALTGVEVGSGAVESLEEARALTALVERRAAGTSSAPRTAGSQVSLLCEYRNDLNGGLVQGFTLTELGVFARVGDESPVLFLYACFSDAPQTVLPIAQGLDVHRFPVAWAVADGTPVTLEYPDGAFLTAGELEDMKGQPGGLAGLDDTGKVPAQQLPEMTAVRAVRTNLLDNWYFGSPVNQIGKEKYTGLTYTVDRWLSLRGDVEIMNDHIRVSVSQADFDYASELRQVLDRELLKSIIGETVTISVLMEIDNAGGANWIQLANDTKNEYAFGTNMDGDQPKNVFSITATVPSTWDDTDYVRFTIGSQGYDVTFRIYAAKLELGSQQTLAWENHGDCTLHEIPNFADQLVRCQRYFYQFNPAGKQYQPIGFGFTWSATDATIVIPIPTTMRAIPIVAMDGTWYLDHEGGVKQVDSITVSDNSVENFIVLAVKTSGLSIGRFCELKNTTNGDARLYFSANL